MTITNLNVFQSGTLASVTPVNENFETLRVGVNSLENTVTNNRTYLDGKVSEINTNISNSVKSIKSSGDIFCLNNGAVNSSGNAAILGYTGSTLSFTTPFTGTDISGNTFVVTSVSSISFSGYANGTYNIFIDSDGETEITSANLYKQKTAPTGVLGAVWLDTSSAPLKAKKYTSNGWEDFTKVPVGYVVVSSGTIQSAVTFSYNQNGYNINRNSIVPVVYPPNFSQGVNKSNGVNYTANSYGWVYVYYLGCSANASASFCVNGVSFTVGYSQFLGSAYGAGSGYFVPIPLGATYSATNATTFIFYPAITY